VLALNLPTRTERDSQGHLIAHRFYGTAGQLMVLDEWPDEQSFQAFFTHMQPQIQSIMEAAGVPGEPHPVFWRKLDAHDDYGWGA
jgi:hypothetical protein